MTTIIFDLDGTLLDSLLDLHKSVNYALEKHKLPIRSINETQGFIGNGVYKLIERSVPQDTPYNTTQRVFQDFYEYYRKHICDHSIPYPGITELLCGLKQMKVKTAIFSNKSDPMVRELHQKIFSGLIDIAYGESENNPKKPCAQAIVNIIHELKAENDRKYYVGDSDIDILTAKNANIVSIGVGWGYGNKNKIMEAQKELALKNKDSIIQMNDTQKSNINAFYEANGL